ncbi:MAG: hypothetical protein H7A23_19545 [Leptospiraceae bacterium]|nr:hypothetical protein [Leptospiraceae bacterium]MCP5496750.1 hypothetical protein [Leptospiraceae bacterium]
MLNRFLILLCLFTFSLYAEEKSISSKYLKKRRSYLEWHQALGLATWVSWLATNVAGEASYKEEYSKYKLSRRLPNYILTSYLMAPSDDKLLLYAMSKRGYEEPMGNHGKLGFLTFTLYGATAFLSFMAPKKVDVTPQKGWSTIFTHKAMIFIHLPCMLALPYLGEKAVHNASAQGLTDMRNVGWLGFAALSVSIATFYF